MQYTVNGSQVISETIDGETVVINLASGFYYSLQGSAVDIWSGILQGAARDEIVSALVEHYDAPLDIVTDAVDRIVAQLEAEALIVASTGDEGGSKTDLRLEGERTPFVSPSIERFSDMQDIIVLDPVHEVDERGWPYEGAAQSA